MEKVQSSSNTSSSTSSSSSSEDENIALIAGMGKTGVNGENITQVSAETNDTKPQHRMELSAQSSNNQPILVDWKSIMSQLTPQFFDDLLKRDAATVKTELQRLGLLEATLNGKMMEDEWIKLENHSQEEFRLFLASQFAAQYLQRTLLAIQTREGGLESSLRKVERKIRETHYLYERVRVERERVAIEIKQVSEEIAECDRLLKSTTTSPPRPPSPRLPDLATKLKLSVENDNDEEAHDDESPWEDSVVLPRTVADHHIRSSLVFNTASPLHRNSLQSNNFAYEPSSPKYARSRASSGTSAGVEDEDLVLFASNNAQNWFYDKVKDAISVKAPLEGITEGSNDNIEGEGDVEEENDEFF
jgi:hypothetical protein